MSRKFVNFFKKNRIRHGELLFQIANLFSTVLSLAVITAGGYLLFTFDKYSPIFETFVFRNVGQLVVLLGSFAVAFSLVGCLFLYYKKKILVGLYVTSMVIIYCSEVGAGLVLIEKKTEIRNSTRKVLEVVIHHVYGQRGGALETKSIDVIQNEMQCCGIDGWKDWLNTSLSRKMERISLKNVSKTNDPIKMNQDESLLRLIISSIRRPQIFDPTNEKHIKDAFSGNLSSNNVKQVIPLSCCTGNITHCQWRGPWNIYKEGCLTQLSRIFSSLTEISGLVISIIGFVQVIGIVFGACILKCVQNPNNRRNLPI